MHLVAKALIVNTKNKILVLTRSSTHPLFAHHLDFPVGEVEESESGREGVVREIFEETGISIDPDKLQLIIQHKVNETKIYETYIGNIGVELPEINLSWEHDEYQWMPKVELLSLHLPDNVDDYYKIVIDNLRNNEA